MLPNHKVGTLTLATQCPLLLDGAHVLLTALPAKLTGVTSTRTVPVFALTLNDSSRTCAATRMTALSIQTPLVVESTARTSTALRDATLVLRLVCTGPSDPRMVLDDPIGPSTKNPKS